MVGFIGSRNAKQGNKMLILSIILAELGEKK